MSTVGDRIRYYRELRNYTQTELAARAGVQFAAISKYERGAVTNIPLGRLEAIADALDVTTGILLGIEPDLIDPVVTDVQREIEARLPELSEYQQNLLLRLIQEFR